MILVIDNYDSFVHNLTRYLIQLGYETKVIRNDAISLVDIANLDPEKIVISPGPCGPEQAGISADIVREFGNKIPILGVCLGHQVIGMVYGGQVIRASYPMHGKASAIIHNNDKLFTGIPSPFNGGRYHSLIVTHEDFPAELEIIAWSNDIEVMALKHRIFPVYGVQFHPESINTDYGYELLKNYCIICS